VAMTRDEERPAFSMVVGTEHELACDLALLALGFAGAEQSPMLAQLEIRLDARGNVARDAGWSTGRDGVFACGDMSRGQSLVAWAIAEGRSAAAAVDGWLMGETVLPAPVRAASSR